MRNDSQGPNWPVLGFLFFLLCLVILSVGWSLRDELVSAWSGLLNLVEKRESIRAFIESFGPWGPFAFIGLQVLQIIVSPIPGEATGFMGGFIFGWWNGFLYASIGLSLGSAAAFFISRQFRRLVRSWLAGNSAYKRFEYLLEHQGIFICFLLFVFPGFPKDFLSYFLGLSRMPWQVFLIIATIGRMPGTLVLTLEGAQVYDGNVAGFVAILGAFLVIGAPVWLCRARIYKWVEVHSLKE